MAPAASQEAQQENYNQNCHSRLRDTHPALDNATRRQMASRSAEIGMDMKQRIEPIELLTEAETAEVLRISQRHLQRLNELGEGPPRTRLGERRIAYPRAGLIAWING